MGNHILNTRIRFQDISYSERPIEVIVFACDTDLSSGTVTILCPCLRYYSLLCETGRIES
jgi:hypothetical protein